jgi:hypothetical protein
MCEHQTPFGWCGFFLWGNKGVVMFVIKEIPSRKKENIPHERLQAYFHRCIKPVTFCLLVVIIYALIQFLVSFLNVYYEIIRGQFNYIKFIHSFNNWYFGFSVLATIELLSKFSISRNVSNSDLAGDVNTAGKRDQQFQIILAVIDTLNYEALEIPTGGKTNIKNICLKRVRLFTDSAFDHAWKDGVSKGLFRLLDSDKFSSR